jgi:imidazolonepropionase-like amidohydrolase
MPRQGKFLDQFALGFAADLLILNANPLEDITASERPDHHVLVTKDGRMVTSR